MKTSPLKNWGFMPATVILGAAVFSAGLTSAGLKKSDSQVKVSAEATKPDSTGKQTITVTLTVNEGWYIYANPVGNKDFESNQTVVKVMADKKELDAKVEYPAGKAKMTGDFNYSVYENKVTLKAHVNRPADAKSLDLEVRISACNVKGICLIPATVKLSVP